MSAIRQDPSAEAAAAYLPSAQGRPTGEGKPDLKFQSLVEMYGNFSMIIAGFCFAGAIIFLSSQTFDDTDPPGSRTRHAEIVRALFYTIGSHLIVAYLFANLSMQDLGYAPSPEVAPAPSPGPSFPSASPSHPSGLSSSPDLSAAAARTVALTVAAKAFAGDGWAHITLLIAGISSGLAILSFLYSAALMLMGNRQIRDAGLSINRFVILLGPLLILTFVIPPSLHFMEVRPPNATETAEGAGALVQHDVQKWGFAPLQIKWPWWIAFAITIMVLWGLDRRRERGGGETVRRLTAHLSRKMADKRSRPTMLIFATLLAVLIVNQYWITEKYVLTSSCAAATALEVDPCAGVSRTTVNWILLAGLAASFFFAFQCRIGLDRPAVADLAGTGDGTSNGDENKTGPVAHGAAPHPETTGAPNARVAPVRRPDGAPPQWPLPR
jgi:hypothetical protein